MRTNLKAEFGNYFDGLRFRALIHVLYGVNGQLSVFDCLYQFKRKKANKPVTLPCLLGSLMLKNLCRFFSNRRLQSTWSRHRFRVIVRSLRKSVYCCAYR